MKPWPGKLDARLYELSTPSTAHRLVCTASAALRANLAQSSAPDALTRGVSERSPMLTSSKTMVLLMTLRRASTLAPRVAWKPKATLSGRLEGLLQAPAEKDDPAAAERLKQWLSGKRHVVVLTGAGLSTDSGIPDYRGKAGSYRLGMLSVYSKVPSTADTHSSVSTQADGRDGRGTRDGRDARVFTDHRRREFDSAQF